MFGKYSEASPSYHLGMSAGCYNITGSSPRIKGKHLYEIWPDATVYQVGYAFHNATKLDDYDQMPDVWK